MQTVVAASWEIVHAGRTKAKGSVLPRRLLASPGARLMSIAGAAQIARRRASPALRDNATGELLVKETMAILEKFAA